MHKSWMLFTLLLLLAGILWPACTAQPTEVPAATATTPPAQVTSVIPTPTATPIPPTHLTNRHARPRAHEAAYTTLAEEFNAAHDDVQIKLVQVESLDAALEVALPAGEGPDVLAGTQEQLGRHVLAGEIAALDATFDTEYLERTFEPAAARAVVWDGRVWGIPETQDGIALLYNRDLVSTIPGDFAALLEEAQAFRAANPAKYYLCNQGLGQSDAYYAAPIYFGHGMDKYGGYVDDQGNVYLNTEESYAAGAWIKDFSEVAPAKTTPELCQAMFNEGQVAIWWSGPRSLRAIQEAGMNYGIAPLGSPFVTVNLFMLTQNAVEHDHAAAAVEVLRYFGSAEVQQRLTLLNNTIPANSAALHAPEVQALELVAGFGAALHQGTPMGNHPYAACQWGAVGDATLAIWNGSQTPVAALDEAQAAIEQCVAEMKRQ